jgi:hypothetical protein
MTLQNIQKKRVWLDNSSFRMQIAKHCLRNFVYKHKKWWICWWIAKHWKHNNGSYEKNMEFILSQLVLEMILVVNWCYSIANIVVHCKNKIDPILSSQNETMPTNAPYWCITNVDQLSSLAFGTLSSHSLVKLPMLLRHFAQISGSENHR